MLRISALNDTSSSEDETASPKVTQTREAKEAEAFAAYNKALSYQQSGSCDNAEKMLRNLFDHPFLKEATSLIENDDMPSSTLKHPGLQLLYSVHKNLAAILLQRKDLKQAMASYIQAVKIDSSEVTVWFKMGQIALKIHNYHLAKICFQQALQCNPNHWPSLDNVISVTFALGDYLMCLEHISCALEKDSYYTKGLVVMRQILAEQPSLESITKELFLYCDPQIHTIAIDKEDTDEHLDECNKIRTKRRQLLEEHNEKEYRSMAFLKPLAPFTWKNVGERLLELYEFATTSDPPKSLGLEVDLRDYYFLDQSIIFGTTPVEEGTSHKTKTSKAKEAEKPARILLKSVSLTEKDPSECPRQGSPFQRAQEQGNVMAATTPEFLKIGDNAKEFALLQRLQGGEEGTSPVSKTPQSVGSKRATTSLLQGKTDSVNPLADLEDMDVGDAFGEMPPLEEAMDITDLNLTDIQKTDFTPDLFLKANDEDLKLANEARSLENVLSTVIDMEFGQESREVKPQSEDRAERSHEEKDQEDPIPPTGISSPAQTKLNDPTTKPGSDVTHPSADCGPTHAKPPPEVSHAPTSSASQTQSLRPSLPHSPHQSMQKGSEECKSGNPAFSHSAGNIVSTSLPPKGPHQSTSVSPIEANIKVDDSKPLQTQASSSALTPVISAPSATPAAASTPVVSQTQGPKSPITPQLRLNTDQYWSTPGEHPPQSSLVASLLSPKSNATNISAQHTPSSLYHSALTSPGKSGQQEHTASFYSTPLSSSAKDLGKSKPESVSDRNVSEPSKCKPSTPLVSTPDKHLSSKPEAEDTRPSQHVLSETPKISVSHFPRQVSATGKLENLSTGDLIEDVIRRHIKGPASSDLSPKNPQVSPSSSSMFPTSSHHSTNRSKAVSSGIHSFVSTPKDPSFQETISPRSINITSLPKAHSPQEAWPRAVGLASPPPAHSSHKSPVKAVGLTSPPAAHSSLGSPKSPHKNQPLSNPFLASPVRLNPLLQHSLSMDAPTYLPMETPDTLGHRSSGSVSLPLHHLNALSALEAEAMLKRSLATSTRNTPQSAYAEAPQGHLAGLMPHRSLPPGPPVLSRSFSLPGHLTPGSTDHLHRMMRLQPPALPTLGDLQAWAAGSTAAASSLAARPSPSSLLDFFPKTTFPPYQLGPRFPGLSSALPTQSSQKPIGLLMGASPPNLPNPFTATGITSPLAGTYTVTSPSRVGDKRSPMHSPRSPVSSVLSPAAQHPKKSPSHPTGSPKHQQRHSPSYQGDHSYHQRGELFQAMVKSMLESSSPHQHQQTSVSPKSAGTQKKTPSGSASGSKRGPKRKAEGELTLGEEWALAYKRRSTRSRSSRTKKETKAPDFGQLMKQYFPETLAVLEEEDSEKEKATDSLPKKSTDDKEEQQGKNSKTGELSSVPALEETEQDDVKLYVKSCLKGHGLLELIRVYLVRLGQKSGLRWYAGLSEIYLKLYDCLRQHLTIPTMWFGDEGDISPRRLRDYTTIMLTKAELCLNKVISERGLLESASPSKTTIASPGPGVAAELFGDFHKYDMRFLEALTNRDDVFDQEGLSLAQFCARFYWLQARQHQVLGRTLDAVDCFEMVQAVLEESGDKEAEKGLVILLPNCGPDGVISLQEVSQMMDSVQRSRSLESTRNLYDVGNYSDVVENLMATFTDASLSQKSAACKERPSQLLLLLDSLRSLGRKPEVMQWGEISLNEAVLHFQRAPSVQLRQDWAATLISIFETLDRAMDEDEGILKSLSHRRLVRLAHNLVSVIQTILDVADTVTEMPVGSVRPWKILYRVLQFEEDRIAKTKQRQADETSDENIAMDQSGEDGEIRPSLTMLIKSHEYLGRHSWCTREQGLLLTFMMSVLGKELSAKVDDEDNDDEDASSAFEQCVYCLYNHPNKRGRARHLSDHNAPPVDMTWEGAGPVFHYFAPHTIPEFDSYKTSTVSSDLEHLMRRIYIIVPDSLQPGQRHTAIIDYIEGTSTALPPIPPSPAAGEQSSNPRDTTDPYQICCVIYYLLGDFHFKNKEPAKAVKFYQLDLALNPSRLDSWAGLALARMSQLTQKLNSTELKIETLLNKKSEAALRCFRRAVELEESSRKLWLEFGSLAYQLHSHASRQVSYRRMFNFSEEILEASRLRKSKMLGLAKSSYARANECEGDGSEDDWLTHYMMGKVAEKQGDPPSVFLEYYKQAALCLHEEEAVYPSKIQFTTLPPHLALEALEIFYRIQASSLKLVLSACDYQCLQELDSFVSEALDGYFARKEEKQFQAGEPEKSEGALSSNKSTALSTPATSQSQKKPKRVYHKNPQDHEYARHKSMSDSQSEGEERRDQTGKSPARSIDTEEGSDLSQDEVSVPLRSATEMRSLSAGQSSNFDVFEISSPPSSERAVTTKDVASVPTVQHLNTEKAAGDQPTAAESMHKEMPMECEKEAEKDKDFGTLNENLSNDQLKINPSNIAEKEKDTVDKTTSVKDVKPEDSPKTKESDIAKGVSKGPMAMVTDAVEENVFLTKSSDQRDLDVSGTPNAFRPAAESNTSKVEKSALARHESLGFSLSENRDIEMLDVDDVEGKDKNREADLTKDSNKINEGQEQRDTSSQATSSVKKAGVSLHNSVNLSGNTEMRYPDKSKEKKTEGDNPSSTSDGKEKWELEDKEKTVASGTSETSGKTMAVSATTTTSSTSAAEVEKSLSQPSLEKKVKDVSAVDLDTLRLEVRRKCMSGLELCASRFSCHYKSLHRLAHAYFLMKDYDKARDLLLGCPDWQQQPHMPAPGLFSDRRQNNFFQGLWKIPIEDIDRSGSFASHVHRSVCLLLDVLAAQGDLDMLLQIRNQLKRTPDSGKKFLRDAERLVLAEEAYLKCLSLIEKTMEKSEAWSESRRESNLLSVYRVWNLGKGGKHGFTATRALHVAFKVMMKGRTDVNRLTPEQAILYCNQNLSKLLTPATPSQGQASQKSVVEKSRSNQSTPVMSLEKQEKAKLQQGSTGLKDEPIATKSNTSSEKAAALEAVCSQAPTLSALQPPTTTGTSVAAATPTAETASQGDEDVIVIE